MTLTFREFIEKNKRVFLVGLIIRLVLAPLTSDSHDVVFWYRSAIGILYNSNLYEPRYFSYPPLWGYILILILIVLSFFVDSAKLVKMDSRLWPLCEYTNMITPLITSPLFNIAFKFPLIILDVVVGYHIADLVFDLSQDNKKSSFAFKLWFLNPIPILVSSVHGTFDVLLTLFVLLSIKALRKRRYFLSGLYWGLSVLAKVYSLSMLVFYIYIIWKITFSTSTKENREDGNNKNSFLFIFDRRFIVGVLKFIFGILCLSIIILPYIVLGTISEILSSLLYSRVRGRIIIGGLSIWSIGFLNNAITNYMKNNVLYLYISLIVLFYILMVGVFEKRKIGLNIIRGYLATVSITLLTMYLVNYQYLLLFIPPLVITMALDYSSGIPPYWKRLYTQIIAGATGFYLSMMGPLHLFIVSSVWFGFPSVNSIVSFTMWYWKLRYGALPLHIILQAIFGLPVTIAIIEVYIRCLFGKKHAYGNIESVSELHNNLRDETKSLSPSNAFYRKAKYIAEKKALILFLVLIFSLSIIDASRQRTVIEMHYKLESSKSERILTIYFKSTILAHFRMCIFGGNATINFEKSGIQKVFIFYEKSYVYPLPNISISHLLGHIIANFMLYGIKDVDIIDSKKLLDIINRDIKLNNTDRVLVIIPTGALPSLFSVVFFSKLRNWVKLGKILVWMGPPPGYYLATKWGILGGNISFSKTFFGNIDPYKMFIPDKPNKKASGNSNISEALDIVFPYTAYGMNITYLESMGGLIIGKVGKGITSIGAIRIGMGWYIHFAYFPTTYEIAFDIASDIIKIVASGILWSSRLLNVFDIIVPAFSTRSISVILDVSIYQWFIVFIYPVIITPLMLKTIIVR